MWMIYLEDLADTKGLNVAADGEFIAWDDVSNGWLPKKVAAAIAGMTDVDLTTPPTQGQTLLYNAVGTKWSAGTLTLGDLGNVDLTGTADNQILKYDLASTSWKNWTPDFLNTTNGYTKTEVDNKLTALATGLEHEISVLAIADTPPASPTLDQVYIVGATPTGVWTGQNNNLARWDGAAWVFDAPRNKEAHLVEAELATYSWNGTNWVKVATASTSGSAAAGDIWTVGSIQQSMLTEPQWATALGAEASKWAIADGRDVTGSKYATLTGNNTIPDLRGAYMRMAGQEWCQHELGWRHVGHLPGRQHSTGLRMHFVAASDGNHHHEQGYYTVNAGYYAYGHRFTGHQRRRCQVTRLQPTLGTCPIPAPMALTPTPSRAVMLKPVPRLTPSITSSRSTEDANSSLAGGISGRRCCYHRCAINRLGWDLQLLCWPASLPSCHRR